MTEQDPRKEWLESALDRLGRVYDKALYDHVFGEETMTDELDRLKADNLAVREALEAAKKVIVSLSADDERCVICNASITPADSGLCDAHKYDEQWLTCHSSEIPPKLAPAQMVEVMFPDGETAGPRPAYMWDWKDGSSDEQITEYRPILDEIGLPYVSSEGLEPYAQYVATDDDGKACQYEARPRLDVGFWWSWQGRDFAPDTHRRPGDWRQSLMRVLREGGV